VVNLFPRSRPSPISAKTFVQTLHLAQDEYINAYGTNSWRETIRTSHAVMVQFELEPLPSAETAMGPR
jgi:hypothetical protein